MSYTANPENVIVSPLSTSLSDYPFLVSRSSTYMHRTILPNPCIDRLLGRTRRNVAQKYGVSRCLNLTAIRAESRPLAVINGMDWASDTGETVNCDLPMMSINCGLGPGLLHMSGLTGWVRVSCA